MKQKVMMMVVERRPTIQISNHHNIKTYHHCWHQTVATMVKSGEVHHREGNQLPPKKRKKVGVIVRNLEIKPADYVKSAFKANGFIVDDVKSEAEALFIKPSKEMLEAYKPEMLDCVRKNDIDKLKAMHKSGLLVNCCNKFGESMLHLACRRGNTDIVRFLLEEAKVNVNIRDDYHRTPLHDACWTTEPVYELVDLLMKLAPEHMIMPDARGYTPFDYVRKEHQGKWLRFLWERRTMLHPNTKAPAAA